MIFAANDGVAPANLQEQIDALQPKSEDDKAPVTVDFLKRSQIDMAKNIGQEDEAWFQGNVVGKTSFEFMNQAYTVYDVTLIHDAKSACDFNSSCNLKSCAPELPNWTIHSWQYLDSSQYSQYKTVVY